MHATCTICGDIFTGIDPEVIRSTQCGHMFHHQCLKEWLNRSRTCPQCRSKVEERNTIKLYFQLGSSETQDTGSLENTVQNLKFQLKMKEMDVNRLTEEHDKMKTQVAGLKGTLMEAEEKNRNNETIVHHLHEKIKMLKIQAKSFTEEKLRNDELQKKLDQYANLEKILKGSAADAADTIALMKDCTDPTILCACINTLKTENYKHKEKSKDLQSLLKFKEQKLSVAVTEISKLEKQISILNRSLTKVKEDLTYTENENESLKKKCKHLEEAIMSPQENSTTTNPRDKALRRFINEYPTPQLKESPVIEINLPSTSSSPTSTVRSQPEEASPTCPIRLTAIKEPKNRFVLNKRRILSSSSSQEKLPCYDGLGGHLKESVSPTDKATLFRAIERSKSHKITLNTKRFKSNPKPEPPKSNLLNFYSKKT